MNDPDKTLLAMGGQKIHQSDISMLVKFLPYLLPVLGTSLATGGITFGATSAVDKAAMMDAARAEVRAEMDLEQCNRDKEWWKDRAVQSGRGLD